MRRLAIATAASTFLLLLVGGVVRGTGSSLACPDWPLCFGQVFPAMTGGVFYEHGHRLVALGVGVMTAVLLVRVARHSRRDRPLCLAAFVVLVTQAVLGGLNVLLRLPAFVRAAHLGLSMVFLGLTLAFVVITWPIARAPLSARTRRLVATLAGLVLGQILLGGLLAYTGGGSACLDEVPLCLGRVWDGLHPAAKAQVVHRALALALLPALALLSWQVVRHARGTNPWVRLLAIFAPVLLLVQIGLGVLSVTSLLGLVEVRAHLGVAALLFGDLWLLWLSTKPVADPARRLQVPGRALVELMKPRITLLAVLTSAVGLHLAPGTPDLRVWATTLLGTLLIVGSANTLNMFLERDVDGLMRRTRHRPLPSGRLTPQVALWFGLAQAVLAVPLLTFGANALAGLTGAVALVLYVLVYTPLKRRTTLALFVGAISGATPPLLGWIAAEGRVGLAGVALFGVLFLWQVPHFVAIALYRKDDYVAAGLKILPAERGDAVAKRSILRFLVVQVAVTLVLVPLGLGGTMYLVGAALLGAGLLTMGVWGVLKPTADRWARCLFLMTVGYLPVLLGLLVAT